MPTYEFRCPEGHEFQRFYKTISSAESEAACPECGATAGRKLSAGAGLLFKGSGFYLTDYGKNAHRGGAPKPAEGGGAAPKSEGKGEAPKSDTPRAEPAKPKTESPKPSAKPTKSE